MKRVRRLLNLSIVLLCVAVATAIVAGFQEPHGLVRRLPDGSELELIAVTYGTRHEIRLGNWYQRPLGPWWSRTEGRFRTALGARKAGAPTPPLFQVNSALTVGQYHAFCYSRKAEPMLWFRIQPPRGSRLEDSSVFELESASIDEHGCRFPQELPGDPSLLGSPVPSAATRDEIAVVEVPNYPRTQRWFTVGLFSKGARGPAATFPVHTPNALIRSGPVRLPEVTSVTEGGATFVSERHLSDGSRRNRVLSGYSFHVTRHGRRSPTWRLEMLTISDLTGNRETVVPDDRGNVDPLPAFCTHAPRLLMDAWFRNDGPESEPDYRWSFRHLPVPSRNKFLAYQGPQPENPSFRLLGLGGVGKDPQNPGQGPHDLPYLLFQFASNPLSYWIGSIHDSSGHEVRARRDVGNTSGLQRDEFEVELPQFGSARWFDLVFCASRDRNIRFVVAP